MDREPSAQDEARQKLEDTRAALLQHVFGREGLPPGLPAKVRRDIHDPNFEALLANARLDESVFDASQGLSSRAYHFVPQGSRRDTTLIFLLGHSGDFPGEAIVPERFVRDGFPVLVLGMVLQGPNRDDRTVELPNGDRETLRRFHGDLAPLEARGLDAMRLFFEPLARAVGYAKARSEHVVVAGISGGGWTADVYGALDPRIDGVVSIAGSIPHSLRVGPDLGDFEQRRARGIYDIAGFEELYLLSALVQPHRQVFHEFDACCFAWSGRASAFFDYARRVQDELTALGRDSGAFALDLIPERSAHRVHPEAIEIIRSVIASAEES